MTPGIAAALLRARLVARRLYYAIPPEIRPKPKVVAGVVTGLVLFTAQKLAVPISPIVEGYITLGAMAGVMWVVRDESPVDPADRAESPRSPSLPDELGVPDEGPVELER